MRHFLLAAALCSLMGVAPASQPATTRAAVPQEPPKIHRMKAGKPDLRGWYPARSTGCGFKISTPAPFNDITVNHREADGTTVTTHMVAATGVKGESYTASATSHSVIALPADAVESYVAALAELGEVRRQQAAKLDGVDGIEIEVLKGKGVTRYRVAQLDNVIYSLKVEIRGQEFLGADEAAARRFFESFCFPTPDPNAVPVPVASRVAP